MTVSASLLLALFLFCAISLLQIRALSGQGEPHTPSLSDYTAFDDASWAVRTKRIQNVLGSHIKPTYHDFIHKCQDAVLEFNLNPTDFVCAEQDKSRLLMNRQQPKSSYNFTQLGYKKVKAPKELFDTLVQFFESNQGRERNEWDSINTYHNMWDAPSFVINLSLPRNEGGGPRMKTRIYNSVQPILEEWTGQNLSPVSLFGIRIYRNNSILAPHVDRMPLITSCIINVGQDVDEDWPLEVYGHNGIATNITMEPGDMIMYESHSVIHGRPFPLNGRFYANVFVHFEPIGPLDPNVPNTYNPVEDLPPYLIAGSKWAMRWRSENPKGWKGVKHYAIHAARSGETEIIKRLAKTNPESLHSEDENGWRPLHEAVRAGHKEVVETLVSTGTDKDHLTKSGMSPLYIAYLFWEEDHPIVSYLESLGAKNISPEL